MTLNSDRFKDALRRWASGVTIITTCCDGENAGMTVSAFSSVSLHPPLVLACADKRSNTNPLIAKSGVFCANILALDQEELSNRFAKTGNEAIRFEGLACERGSTGSPRLPGALATLDCRVDAAHDAGDHVIYVGAVVDAQIGAGKPLLYYDAGYHFLEPLAP
jgi:flavin reductase (DIM6/NTAB) family NADH-FMN oxidoreductase RutF